MEPADAWTPERRKTWRSALLLGLVCLVGMSWLLARLLWLPFYCGLFFFLVAGLLIGGLSFRLARRARPIAARRIILGITIVSSVGTGATVCWEFRHVAGTVGDPPAFAKAIGAGSRGGASRREVRGLATAAFRRRLAREYPPGGTLGYVRWAVASGEMEVEVKGIVEEVGIHHRGWVWPLRSLAAFLLSGVGFWLSFESLRSPTSVTNILPAGEAYDEVE